MPKVTNSSRSEIGDIFLRCPQVADVKYIVNGVDDDGVHETAFWAALSTNSLPELEYLSFQSPSNSMINFDALRNALSVIGHRLKNLSLTVDRKNDHSRLLSILSDNCHSLVSFCYDYFILFLFGSDVETNTPYYVKLLKTPTPT